LRLYLDTSVINFLFAEDSPEKKEVTRRFFDRHVESGEYEVFVSDLVIREITRTSDPAQRERLLSVIRDYSLGVLDSAEFSGEIQPLAGAYLESGVFPRRKLDDSLHVALATVAGMDFLLSWNYRHLANVNKEMLVQADNLRLGYVKTPRMTTPMEVLHDDD
jgi:predicted nucleic acid-binding protein